MESDDKLLPTIAVEPEQGAPVREIKPRELQRIAQNLTKMFEQFESDRKMAEQEWLRSLRQYLGLYDPEIERQLDSSRSRVYPRITRVKCVSVLARLMNLMFPGNERNWTLKASPSADMSPQDVMQAVQRAQMSAQKLGIQFEMTPENVQDAVQRLADERAELLATMLDDQLQELGGDQTHDYVTLNRKVARSGVLYGVGVLIGPFVREIPRVRWVMSPTGPMPEEYTAYRPQYEFLPVWDFYPDMSSKTLTTMDQDTGYFVRMVVAKNQLRKLARRSDFLEQMVKKVIIEHPKGNYKPKSYETELRSLGVKEASISENSVVGRYEIIVWHGPVDAQMLMDSGVDVPEDARGDDIEAEVWMIGNQIIKADINPWRRLGVDMKSTHVFVFDEDDTSPLGRGLPVTVRDSQMAVCAAARMLMDNASAVCGPMVEINTSLLEEGQEAKAIGAFERFYRDDYDTNTAHIPAIRDISLNSHLSELLSTMQTFMTFADQETFVGPATGGDMERGYSEPMRTAAGASMMRGDAALPFKDIVRNFDVFTQSVIQSMVVFNKKFNPEAIPSGDYNVIARGASSLIAKEIRGIQVDQLAATLTDEERMHVDDRKFVEARFGVRDLNDLLLPKSEVEMRRAQGQQKTQEMEAQQKQMIAAQIRETLAGALKDIAQAQKNSVGADATLIDAALKTLEKGMTIDQLTQGAGEPAVSAGQANNAGGNGAAQGA